jgi:hypothetical protein
MKIFYHCNLKKACKISSFFTLVLEKTNYVGRKIIRAVSGITGLQECTKYDYNRNK